MPGLTRRGMGPGSSGSKGSGDSKDSKATSSSSKYRKPVDLGGGSKARYGAPGLKNVGKAVSYAKPQRTVQILEDNPCYLSGCPTWVKTPTLWAPRLSAKVVDTTSLGFGRHGSQVLLVRHRTNGGTVVVKQFRRDKLLATPRLQDKMLNEWRVHSTLVPHPNVVPLYGAMEDKTYVSLIMEAQTGDLLSYLDEQDREVLSEDEARAVAADVLAALVHMHDLGFVHRDLKPENVFSEPLGPPGAGLRHSPSPAPAASWRLGDLGSAVELERAMQTGAPGLQLEGSPPFLSPEYAALWVAPAASRTPQQLQQATTAKLDIWGLGALLYDTLVGHPPFSVPPASPSANASSPTSTPAAAAASSAGAAPSAPRTGAPALSSKPPFPSLTVTAAELPTDLMLEAIMHRPPSPTPAEAGLSAGAIAFLSAALQKDPQDRPSAAELLEHPWLREQTGADGGSEGLGFEQRNG